MQQANKRSRVTKESTISDITASVRDISDTLSAIGKTHQLLLKSNEIIVKHLLTIEEKQKKKLNYSELENPTTTPTEQSQGTPLGQELETAE